ncbi:uncharacterized protein [Asterias amurensis]|uniref:uncharacterized protein n=1 Tax=Asterias amurensis TaxID=7602 RepID=UPI003AB737AD
MGPSRRGDRAFWTTAEVRKLISVFARKEIQRQLDGTTRNRIAFEKMSSVLRSVGFNRTPAQCREKIKSMKKDYRKGKTSQFSAIIGKLMETYPVALRHAAVDDDLVGATGEELEASIMNKLQAMADEDIEEEEEATGSDDEIWNEESDRGWMSSDDQDDPNMDTTKQQQRKRGADRMSHWSPVETLELLRIIGERDTQAALRKMVHTRLVWESISGKMSTNRSAEHCHDRWIYLKRRYRETVLKKQTDRCANCSYYSELAKILAKQPPDNDQSTSQSTRASGASSGNTSGLSFYSRTNARSGWPSSSTPRLPGSDDENDFDDDGDNQEIEDDDIDDLFGPNRVHDTEVELEGEMSDDNGNHQSALLTDPTPATTSESRPSNKREAAGGPSQRNPKRPRGVRAKPQVPPKEDLSIAEAITDAMMRFIDHHQFHLSQQTEILERYLKFERARMRWEMDMETRRMKWEEERDMREEERRQRAEELEEKRVSDNRQFMLQLAVVLGNNAATDDRGERTKGGDAAVANSSAK